MNHQTNNNNDEQAFRVAYLVAGFMRHTLTKEEHDELDAWVEESDANMLMFEELTDQGNIDANLDWMNKIDKEQRLEDVKQQFQFNTTETKRPSRRIWQYSIAASILVLIAFGYLITKTPETRRTDEGAVVEILPAVNKTVVRLSDGTVVDLSTTADGRVASETNALLTKQNGALLYSSSKPNGQVLYNTLSTSIGGTYQVILPDGSHAWVNAKSSLKYPTMFSGSERVVELSGEAYFEVAKDRTKPFKVRMPGMQDVEVLGTHFNIQCYEDEPLKETSLFEGSVLVSNSGKQVRLAAGEQAISTNNGIQTKRMHYEQTLPAWKEDSFAFHDADIETIMRQIGRWYDIEVKYEDKVSNLFNANISRKEPLSKFLHLLEVTGKVHFKTEKNKIHVIR